MFLSDLQQLTDCKRTLLPVLASTEENALEMMNSGLSSVGLRGIKSVKLQRAIILVGMFSIVESALQAETGWKQPIETAKRLLKNCGEAKLAASLQRYELVVNTLKHGFGRSHTALVAASERNFAVRSALNESSEDEYVDIDSLLVDVTHDLVIDCADIIEKLVDFDLPNMKSPVS